MRNIARIGSIIKILTEIWYKQSDLRLGQLIINAVEEATNWKAGNIFFLEDDDLYSYLHYYKRKIF
jgi:uncharacterized protein YihD (DUF1040 family)